MRNSIRLTLLGFTMLLFGCSQSPAVVYDSTIENDKSTKEAGIAYDGMGCPYAAGTNTATNENSTQTRQVWQASTNSYVSVSTVTKVCLFEVDRGLLKTRHNQ